MEMQVDRELIRKERERRAWSQSHLAAVAGLGLRTVQRIEATGNAAYESAAAIATVLSLTVADLVPSPPSATALEGAALPRNRPPRAALPLATAAAAGVVVIVAAVGALTLLSPGSPDADLPASQPAVAQAELAPVAGGDVPAASCPAENFGGLRMSHLEMECESVDPDWAPTVERQLRSLALGYLADWPDLGERFRLGRVQCRTTICELQFFDSASAGAIEVRYDARDRHDDYARRGLWQLSHEIYREPWSTQFDPWQSNMIGSLVDGESRLYLRRMPSAL